MGRFFWSSPHGSDTTRFMQRCSNYRNLEAFLQSLNGGKKNLKKKIMKIAEKELKPFNKPELHYIMSLMDGKMRIKITYEKEQGFRKDEYLGVEKCLKLTY